jgi:hypothetical protein
MFLKSCSHQILITGGHYRAKSAHAAPSLIHLHVLSTVAATPPSPHPAIAHGGNASITSPPPSPMVAVATSPHPDRLLPSLSIGSPPWFFFSVNFFYRRAPKIRLQRNLGFFSSEFFQTNFEFKNFWHQKKI